ncbi:hypothetical protein STEG23_032690 [Scotinomys teguina]
MRSGGLGRCRHFFWLGVSFDAVGVAVLFTGVFANLLFYDMLLYLGSVIIFVSLLWWIFWYTGNIEALPEDPSSRTLPRAGEVGVHRSGSLSFSLTLRRVSNTLQRIHRRRRRRLLPRVLQTIRSLSLIDPGQLEGNSDAATKGGRTSFHPAKPVSVLNQAARLPLRSSGSIALLRALATSKARAQQRAAQLPGFLNAHHGPAAAAAQVLPESPESESDHHHEKPEPELTRQPECPGFEDIDYETEFLFERTEPERTESQSDI